MPVQPGQSVGFQFITQSLTGEAQNADSLPAGFLVRNGDDSAEAVTITNIATGVYKAAYTIPTTWDYQDTVAVRIEATVGGIAAKAIRWWDQIEAVQRAGAGAVQVVLEIRNTSNQPVPDCEVWVTTDAAGDVVAAGAEETDADGKVRFWLDPGTYYRWAQRTGVDFDNPQTFAVTE